MIRFILNADDFGLTPGVNRSILDLHRNGALSSATLMATADHASAAEAGSIVHPGLGVGCHVVLVDGKPALPPAHIPALTLPSGAFRPTLGGFVSDLLRGSIPEAEIEMEATAQIRRLQSAGVRLTHIDTHKHTHMFPRVLRPLLRAALACGIQAIRNPFEPDWALKATLHAPAMRRLQVRMLRNYRQNFLKLVQQASIATTNGVVGVLATGTLNAEVLNALLAAMPDGTWELVSHPGYFDEYLNNAHTRLRESRAVEHAALLETIPRFLAASPQTKMIQFSQLWERLV